jgi:hypothetical protein
MDWAVVGGYIVYTAVTQLLINPLFGGNVVMIAETDL